MAVVGVGAARLLGRVRFRAADAGSPRPSARSRWDHRPRLDRGAILGGRGPVRDLHLGRRSPRARRPSRSGSSSADRFTVAQAKRLFGLIGAGGVVAVAGGSALAAVLSQRLAPRALLFAGAAATVLAALGPLWLHNSAQVVTPTPEAGVDDRIQSRGPWRPGIRSGPIGSSARSRTPGDCSTSRRSPRSP